MISSGDAMPISPSHTSEAGSDTEFDATFLALLLKHQRRAWSQGERVLVETYLDEQPQVRADVQAVLDLIYNEIMLREEAGESPQLEEYLDRFPELDTELRLQFELERAMSVPSPESVSDLTMVSVTPSRPAPMRAPFVRGYEILGELGRGGMGVVYKARQLRLNRIVALKMILAGDHASPEAGLRFLAEAESVARLHHPHIVQIYAFGDCEGRPFFEMEYVAGGCLSDRLDGSPRPPRDAARLAQTLARAIHEAHQLGIVHRDLKPANILLTPEGVPKIADFGLAKWLDVETGLTRTQLIVGSPNYMAPEQAGPTSAPIGPAADVYSLGAILYELLIGRPPFQAATVLQTLEQVRSDEPIVPARMLSRLPRDLVTICLKCLEKEPARRYASAIALAEDLRRFEDGHSIHARPVGGHERLWRWCRREPVVASLALALLAGLIGVATQWWRAESHLKDAIYHRGRAEESANSQRQAYQSLQVALDGELDAHKRARKRFDAAMRALGEFESIINHADLLRATEMESLRASLLQTALGVYKELQASLEEDASPEACFQLSEAYTRVASISWELGMHAEALATHRRALALIEQMAATAPDDPEVRAALATCHAQIGFTLRTTGHPVKALGPYEQARAIQERLARENPDLAHHQEVLSWTLSNIGVIYLDLGRPADAIRLHQNAIEIHQALVGRHPQNLQFRSDLAWCWRYLCLAQVASGDSVSGLRLVERAAALHEELVAADPRAVEFRWRLARCLDEVGRIRCRSGRPADAAGPLERSAELYAAVAHDNPVLYRLDVARNQLNLAFQRAVTGRRDEALVCIQRAEDLLSRSSSVWPVLLYDLACDYSLCASVGNTAAVTSADLESCARRAVGALRRASAAGYSEIGQVRHDPAFDILRSRRDFQELVMDTSFPVNPFQR
jgi:eukaryotic-like serine/threonine-protein kinase